MWKNVKSFATQSQFHNKQTVLNLQIINETDFVQSLDVVTFNWFWIYLFFSNYISKSFENVFSV